MRRLLLLATAAIVAPPAAAEPQRAPRAVGQPVSFTVIGRFSDGTTADITTRVYAVTADADADGDGRMDEGVLTVRCPAGGGTGATAEFAPRDAASGMASGKRQHQPLPIRRGADGSPAPALVLKGSWDLATLKGARSAAPVPVTRVVTLQPGADACRAPVPG